MDQAAIFLPMCALAAWTFAVLLDFRFGESPRVPAAVSLPNRNFMNLLELPMLFYVVGLALYATLRVDAAAVILAALWLRFAVALLAR
jgi:hypothetical protein